MIGHPLHTIALNDLGRLVEVSAAVPRRWIDRYTSSIGPMFVAEVGKYKQYSIRLIDALLLLRLARPDGKGRWPSVTPERHLEEVHRLVAHDAHLRNERGVDHSSVYLGALDRLEADAALLTTTLTPVEQERLRRVQARFVEGALYGLWDAPQGLMLDRLRTAVLAQPAVLRFVFTGDDDELPANDLAWRAWSANFVVLHFPTKKKAA